MSAKRWSGDETRVHDQSVPGHPSGFARHVDVGMCMLQSPIRLRQIAVSGMSRVAYVTTTNVRMASDKHGKQR